jgi:D-galactarolactone cycloisomerase
MRISAVDVFVLKIEHHYRLRGVAETPGRLPSSDYFFEPHWRQAYSRKLEAALVKVTTDTGLIGWGEAQAPILPEAAAVVVRQLLGPFLLGRDPLSHATLFDAMYHLNNVRGHSGGFTVDAIAALDVALWDLAGQHFGAPIHVLMGGPARTRLPAYVSGLRQPTLDEQCTAATSLMDQGFDAFKLFLGHGVEQDVETLTAIRDTVGPKARLMCDLLWRYELGDALRVGRTLDALGYRWLEAPVAPEDVDGHATLAHKLDTRVAVGETLRTVFEFRNWLAARAMRVAQPDIMRTGLTGARNIAALCQAEHVPIAPHVGVSTGVGIATTWQFAAATPGFEIQEYQHDLMPGATVILDSEFALDGGTLVVPDGPGLGISVNEQAVADHAVAHWQVS